MLVFGTIAPLIVNAVKDFCSRIRENSGFHGLTIPKSHDFGYKKPPVSSKKNPSLRCLTVR